MTNQKEVTLAERKHLPSPTAKVWAKDDRAFAGWAREMDAAFPHADLNGQSYGDLADAAEERVREFERLYGEIA